MSVERVIFQALRSLVADRVYEDTIPQLKQPVWPAMRWSVIGGAIANDLCGSGAAQTDDVLVQLDIVSINAAERRGLVAAARIALLSLSVPCLLQGGPRQEYDAEMKVYRASIDFTLFYSSR